MRQFDTSTPAQVYSLEFQKHLSSDRLTYAALYAELRASSLSDTVKDAMPTPERLRTTVRNLNWIIAYWHLRNSNVPAPLDGSCGFSVSSHGAGVSYSDEA